MKKAAKIAALVVFLALVGGAALALRPDEPEPEWLVFLRQLHKGDFKEGLPATWSSQGPQMATEDDATGTQELMQGSDLTEREASRLMNYVDELLKRKDVQIVDRRFSKGDRTRLVSATIRERKRYTLYIIIPDPARRAASIKAGAPANWYGIAGFSKFTPLTVMQRIKRYMGV